MEGHTQLMFADVSALGIFPACVNQEQVLLSRLIARRQGVEPLGNVMRIGIGLRGDLDQLRLSAVLTELVTRHPALRVVFSENLLVPPDKRELRFRYFYRTGVFEPGSYVQSVVKITRVTLDQHDLRDKDAAQQDLFIKKKTDVEDLKSFGHAEVPRIRAVLLQLRLNECLLILFVDHMVCDAVSLHIIRNELEALFHKDSRNSDTRGLGARQTSFPEFAAWQSRALRTSYFTDDLVYWREQWAKFASARIAYKDIPFALNAPEDVRYVRCSTEYEQLTVDESDGIRLFARRARKTLFVVFLAAFALVLCKYTGKSVIAIWGHFANRMQSEAVGTIGWFSNSHILGIDLSANPSGADLLRQVANAVNDALEHQELPLPHLWQVLSCRPMILDAVVLLDFRAIPRGTESQEGRLYGRLQLTRVPLPPSATPRFSSLGLYVVDDDSGLSITSHYSPEHFSSAGVRQMLTDVRTAVIALAEDPGATVLNGPLKLRRRNVNPDSCAMGEFAVLRGEVIPAVPGQSAAHARDR